MVSSIDRALIFSAALSGFTAVALGAFGAHGLKDRLAPDLMVVYQTAVRRQWRCYR